jgi:hypothetical protein
MLPLHHDHHVSGDDRTRTGACSPDKRVLLPLSYVPLHSAGGIRTHDLELMRLAGTATPLRRDLPGWSRTSDLRRPKPAGWPTPLQADDLTMMWEEGLASLKRGGALLRTLPVAIRCSSARLPVTVVDRQGDALSP